MVLPRVAGYLVVCCLLLNYARGLDNNRDDDNQKTVKKRGIVLSSGIYPHVHHYVPHINLPITGPTVFPKPIQPPLFPGTAPLTPFHITPGGATVTSISATYPRFPIFTRIPPPPPPPLPALPFPAPHCHGTSKPLIPVAVPFPGLRRPKIPVLFNPTPIKPILFKPHHHQHFVPVVPTFVSIPIPATLSVSSTPQSGIFATATNLLSTTTTTQKTPHAEQEHAASIVPQGSWRPIVALTKPPPVSFTSQHHPFNYHAILSQSVPANDLIAGQGPVSSQLAQQLAALYQHNLHHQHHQNFEDNFSIPTYQAEKFTQNYDLPSNDGSFNGLSSYQVPLHQ